jgi:hypothetical protein
VGKALSKRFVVEILTFLKGSVRSGSGREAVQGAEAGKEESGAERDILRGAGSGRRGLVAGACRRSGQATPHSALHSCRAARSEKGQNGENQHDEWGAFSCFLDWGRKRRKRRKKQRRPSQRRRLRCRRLRARWLRLQPIRMARKLLTCLKLTLRLLQSSKLHSCIRIIGSLSPT